MENYIYKKQDIISGLVIKGIAILAGIYGLIMGIETLHDLTYFTNLSNILIILILLVFGILDIIILSNPKKCTIKKQYLFITKFALTLCISITWLIYMCILAPTNDDGFFASYMHHHFGSLCLHFITPVLAIIDFILFDYNYNSTGKHCFYAILPPILYVLFIVILAETGVRWGDDMKAPYNFLNYNTGTGWFGFDLSSINSTTLGIGVAYMIFVLILIFLGIGRLFLLFKDIRKKSQKK